MGNYHVPFWRAVGVVTPSLTLIILTKGLSTVGHTGRSTLDVGNALGDSSSTFAGANLLEQDGSLIKESKCLKTLRVLIIVNTASLVLLN